LLQLFRAARGAQRLILAGANKNFDNLVTRFALVFIKRHDCPQQASGLEKQSIFLIIERNEGFENMKLPELNRNQLRQVDQTATDQYAMPSIVLMENAGAGAARLIHERQPEGNLVILCGSGNNAGDGYAVARHLQLYDREVKIVSVVPLEKLSGDAATNYRIASKAGIEITAIERPAQLAPLLQDVSVIIDGLLGTGATGDLRGIYPDVVNSANEQTAVRVALDIPTGLDCDTGEASNPTFRADLTISFVAEKVGFKKNRAKEFLGTVQVVGIGVPRKLLEAVARDVTASGQT